MQEARQPGVDQPSDSERIARTQHERGSGQQGGDSTPPLCIRMAPLCSRAVIAPACLMGTRLALLFPAVLPGIGAVALLVAARASRRRQKSYVLDRPRFTVVPVLAAVPISAAPLLAGTAVRPRAIAAGIGAIIGGRARTVMPALVVGLVAAQWLIAAVPASPGGARVAVAPVLGLGTVAACAAATALRAAAAV